MQAQTHTPAVIFGYHIRYVIPLFQRPYVWNQKEQWEPLWDDIRTLAERLLTAPAGGYGLAPVPPHFLGAIVLDQQAIPSGFIAVRNVIDGQQRLTTLQLLLDAAQLVVQQHGAPQDAQALRILILNDPAITQQPHEVFKVWPTDRDQEAFHSAMSDDVQVPAHLSESRIVQAHQFFVKKISEWSDPDGDQDKRYARLHALVVALREHLKLVVIDLEPGDNAQVIFETLNHRGAPLLAADLVKNFVFQLANAQGADVQKLYDTYWRPLDGDPWRQLVAQGRLYRPRIDVFLTHWLTMKLLREVPADRVFTDFRDNVITADSSISDVLSELASDAAVYDALEKLPQTSVEGLFYYRVIKALDSAVVSPFLLWILRWSEDRLPVEQRHRALRALESWLVRRALARATSKDTNRLILELLQELGRRGPEQAGDIVETFLGSQAADSRYWPDDQALHATLATQPLYKMLTRPRLRMLLEALEDSYRGALGEGQPCPRGLTVEHIMPQSWEQYWGADLEGDPVGALRRGQLVQSLGNLTLVNDKLNPTLSNRPWTTDEASAHVMGGTGKRDYLLKHSELKLNAHVVASHEEGWSEDAIRQRGTELIDRIAEIWPRPAAAVQPSYSRQPLDQTTSDQNQIGPVSGEPEDDEDSDVDSPAGKYNVLRDWLGTQAQDELALTFAQVEQVLDSRLPASAYNHLTHWYGYKGTALGRAIRDAGWRATQVSLADQHVVLVRDETSAG